MLLTVTCIVSPASSSPFISSQGSGIAAFIDSDKCLFSLSYFIALTGTTSPSLYKEFGFTGPL